MLFKLIFNKDRGYGGYHEVFNVGLCVYIIAYIYRNSFLRNAYKVGKAACSRAGFRSRNTV